jgi:hypothetical protein
VPVAALVDGAAMIVLGLDDSDGGEEWVRVFFDAVDWIVADELTITADGTALTFTRRRRIDGDSPR